MAAATAAPFQYFNSSPQRRKIPSLYSTTSTLLNAYPRDFRSRLYLLTSNPGSAIFSGSAGLRNLGISFKRIEIKKRVKCRDQRRMVVHASLFGVGAPEVLVIGVVALLVFGPKGLAEVARSLGKTLRAFQPTIRELQDVSNEFKSTIEREIGIDEIQSSLKNPYTPPPPTSKPEIDSKEEKRDEETKQTTPKLPPVSMENLLKKSAEQLAASQEVSTTQSTSEVSATQSTSEVSATQSTSEASANQQEETTVEIDQSNPNKNTPIS
ncbi:Sec-independent protein translocase protein TATB, chloroplastic [Zostera marina]|uniref:Sec-independent protein translocase protein TATB, chloroplastic n=1 Tax=Zostera marina TaxID=29655 RepID=A0A0K9P534_ZOSMR|nr:Sec-independent protein translocase protein TATB, chloroplastic [Zostera marina]